MRRRTSSSWRRPRSSRSRSTLDRPRTTSTSISRRRRAYRSAARQAEGGPLLTGQRQAPAPPVEEAIGHSTGRLPRRTSKCTPRPAKGLVSRAPRPPPPELLGRPPRRPQAPDGQDSPGPRTPPSPPATCCGRYRLRQAAPPRQQLRQEPERSPGVTCRGCGVILPRSRMRACPECSRELPRPGPRLPGPPPRRPGPPGRARAVASAAAGVRAGPSSRPRSDRPVPGRRCSGWPGSDCARSWPFAADRLPSTLRETAPSIGLGRRRPCGLRDRLPDHGSREVRERGAWDDGGRAFYGPDQAHIACLDEIKHLGPTTGVVLGNEDHQLQVSLGEALLSLRIAPT